MGGCGGDHDDAIAGLQPAVAMDHQAGVERPARPRLGLDLRQLLLGHAGIVLEGHRALGVAAHLAHQPDEAGDAAALRLAGPPRPTLGPDNSDAPRVWIDGVKLCLYRWFPFT